MFDHGVSGSSKGVNDHDQSNASVFSYQITQSCDTIRISLDMPQCEIQRMEIELVGDELVFSYRQNVLHLVFRGKEKNSQGCLSEGQGEKAVYYRAKKLLIITLYKSTKQDLYITTRETPHDGQENLSVPQNARFYGFLNQHAYIASSNLRKRSAYTPKWHLSSRKFNIDEARVIFEINNENERLFDIEHFFLDQCYHENPMHENLHDILEYARKFSDAKDFPVSKFFQYHGSAPPISHKEILHWLSRNFGTLDAFLAAFRGTQNQESIKMFALYDFCCVHKDFSGKASEEMIVWQGDVCQLTFDQAMGSMDSQIAPEGHSGIDGDSFEVECLSVLREAVWESSETVSVIFEGDFPLAIYLSVLSCLIELVISIVYDDIITCGEGNSESTWTIEMLATSLCHNRKFFRIDTPEVSTKQFLQSVDGMKSTLDSLVHDIVASCAMRCVAVPMLRSVHFFRMVLRATACIFSDIDHLSLFIFRTIFIFRQDELRYHHVKSSLEPMLCFLYYEQKRPDGQSLFVAISSCLAKVESRFDWTTTVNHFPNISAYFQ